MWFGSRSYKVINVLFYYINYNIHVTDIRTPQAIRLLKRVLGVKVEVLTSRRRRCCALNWKRTKLNFITEPPLAQKLYILSVFTIWNLSNAYLLIV